MPQREIGLSRWVFNESDAWQGRESSFFLEVGRHIGHGCSHGGDGLHVLVESCQLGEGCKHAGVEVKDDVEHREDGKVAQ